MSDAHYKIPAPYNEPILSYAPGSKEKAELKAALALVSNKIDDGKKQAIKGLSRTKSIPTIK